MRIPLGSPHAERGEGDFTAFNCAAVVVCCFIAGSPIIGATAMWRSHQSREPRINAAIEAALNLEQGSVNFRVAFVAVRRTIDPELRRRRRRRRSELREKMSAREM